VNAPWLSITKEDVVFDGELGRLKPHRHAVVALLLGLERSFDLVTACQSGPCAVAIVPAGVEHALDFHGARSLVIYVEPHDRGYSAFHRAAGGRCPTLPELTAPWRQALARWHRRRDSRPIVALAHDTLAAPGPGLDPRLRVLAGYFNRGLLLESPATELGQKVRLSPSRLVHLTKTELGVGLRRLKLHYRFKLVAAAALSGKNLTTAAHAAGFADSGHFSRSFAETFGLNPSEVLLRAARGESRALPQSRARR